MRDNRNQPDTVVILLAFGAPRSPHETGWFLEQLLGKKPASTQIEDLQRRYRAIGGNSPLFEITSDDALAAKKSREQLAREAAEAIKGSIYSYSFGIWR